MTQSIGPMSLPICHPVPRVAVTHQPYSDVTAPAAATSVGASVGTAADSGIMAMSRSCDCLTQTDISAVLTPRNEQMPPDPPAAQFLQFKKVDISLETSDSEAATSSGRPGLQQLSQHQSRLLQQSDNGGGGGGATSGGLCRSRSKSPRPQTLPGLVKASAENQAENRVTSPQAPLPVKAYAKNLIEGIISDTITHVPISDDDDLADQSDNDKCNINEETDVSLSLETDTAVANTAGSGPSTAVVTSGYPASVAAAAILAATSTKSPSSHVETDSLDESEHAGQHS